ncbi:hypothetical protein D3C77_494440 [compost metagenome]
MQRSAFCVCAVCATPILPPRRYQPDTSQQASSRPAKNAQCSPAWKQSDQRVTFFTICLLHSVFGHEIVRKIRQKKVELSEIAVGQQVMRPTFPDIRAKPKYPISLHHAVGWIAASRSACAQGLRAWIARLLPHTERRLADTQQRVPTPAT